MPDTRTANANGSEPTLPWPRWRVILIRVWAGLLTAQALVMAQGIVVIGSAGPGERFGFATSTIWKLLSLGGVALVLWTGGRSIAGFWAIGVGQLVWAVAGLLAPQADANGPLLSLVNLVIFYAPLIALRPRRRQLLHPQFQANPTNLIIAAAGSIPLVSFATHLAGQLPGELGFDMVGLYLVLGAMGLFGALRPQGQRWIAQVVGAGAALTGIAAIGYPQDLASPGLLGGAMLLTGGAVFAATAGAGDSVLRPFARLRPRVISGR